MRSKKVIYSIITNILLQLITIVYGFIVPKIIISNYGSNVNGLISSITQFLTYIALLESGFGPVVKSVLYKPIAKKDNKTIANILKTTEKFFRTIAFIFIIYIIILCIFYPMLVNKDFTYIYTVSLILIIGISTFFEYFFGMTYKLYLQADQKSYIISIIQAVTYLFSVIVIVIFSKIGVNIQILKLVSSLIFIFRPLAQNYYVKKKYNINFKDVDSNYALKQKWDGLAQHIAAVIHSNTDITILTIFVSLTEVSVYSVYSLVVKGLKSLILSFSSGIDSAWGDMIAKNEKQNLNRKFKIYEILYNNISVICFSSSLVLITPFISIYTKGITDANYIRYIFGYLIVISEYIWAIRLPYSSIVLAAGHFRETRIGAWVECTSNILISMLLVWRFGLIGVTIGTIVAMAIRTIEFIYHTNKYILNRSILESIKNILIVIVETIIILLICKVIPFMNYSNYFNLLFNAILTGIVSFIVVLSINIILFKREFGEAISILNSIFKKQKKESNINIEK